VQLGPHSWRYEGKYQERRGPLLSRCRPPPRAELAGPASTSSQLETSPHHDKFPHKSSRPRGQARRARQLRCRRDPAFECPSAAHPAGATSPAEATDRPAAGVAGTEPAAPPGARSRAPSPASQPQLLHTTAPHRFDLPKPLDSWNLELGSPPQQLHASCRAGRAWLHTGSCRRGLSAPLRAKETRAPSTGDRGGAERCTLNRVPPSAIRASCPPRGPLLSDCIRRLTFERMCTGASPAGAPDRS
jgi:hypothetical protein